jgi:hypothetical protein
MEFHNNQARNRGGIIKLIASFKHALNILIHCCYRRCGLWVAWRYAPPLRGQMYCRLNAFSLCNTVHTSPQPPFLSTHVAAAKTLPLKMDGAGYCISFQIASRDHACTDVLRVIRAKQRIHHRTVQCQPHAVM